MYKKWRWITFLMSLAATVLFLIGVCLYGSIATLVLLSLAFVLFIVSAILDYLKCCCPSCQRHIRERNFLFDAYENCPYCGADLDSWKYQ